MNKAFKRRQINLYNTVQFKVGRCVWTGEPESLYRYKGVTYGFCWIHGKEEQKLTKKQIADGLINFTPCGRW